MGRDQVSWGVTVPSRHATSVENVLLKPLKFGKRSISVTTTITYIIVNETRLGFIVVKKEGYIVNSNFISIPVNINLVKIFSRTTSWSEQTKCRKLSGRRFMPAIKHQSHDSNHFRPFCHGFDVMVLPTSHLCREDLRNYIIMRYMTFSRGFELMLYKISSFSTILQGNLIFYLLTWFGTLIF